MNLPTVAGVIGAILVGLIGAGMGWLVGRREEVLTHQQVPTPLTMERRLLPFILSDGTRGVDTCYRPVNVILPEEWRADTTKPASEPDSSLMVPWDPTTGRPWDSLPVDRPHPGA